MTEQKKQPSPTTGYFLIIAGILGLAARLFISSGTSSWGVVAIIKLVVSVSVLILGIVTVLKNRKL